MGNDIRVKLYNLLVVLLTLIRKIFSVKSQIQGQNKRKYTCMYVLGDGIQRNSPKR